MAGNPKSTVQPVDRLQVTAGSREQAPSHRGMAPSTLWTGGVSLDRVWTAGHPPWVLSAMEKPTVPVSVYLHGLGQLGRDAESMHPFPELSTMVSPLSCSTFLRVTILSACLGTWRWPLSSPHRQSCVVCVCVCMPRA